MSFFSRLSKDQLQLIWLGLALLAARLLAQLVLNVYDDAFITFRYGQNLAAGNGFVYNVGEPVMGTTAPAWGVLVGLIELLGLPAPETVVMINILCDLLILGLTVYAVAPKEGMIPCYLFGALFAISPIVARVCVGGMEVNAFLLISLAAIYLYTRGSVKSAIALASISYFFRPEGVMLAGLLVGLEFFTGVKSRAIKMAGIALLVVTPPLLLIYSYYGQIFPQSVVAKSRIVKTPLWEFITNFYFPEASMVAIFPFALWGFVLAFRREGFLRLVAYWGALYIVVYFIARPFTWTWYGEPIYYTFLLLGALAIYDLGTRFLPRISKPLFAYSAVLGGVLAIAVWSGILIARGPSGVTNRVHRPLERWIAENLDSNVTIVALDYGALGYYSRGRARIFDMAGLVTPEMYKFKTDREVFDHYSPDYLFLTMTGKMAETMSDPVMVATYRPLIRFSEWGETDITLKPENFPTGWSHDFVMFKRMTPRPANAPR